MNRPLPLLLFVGFFLGLNFPLGKLAMAAGIDPALWAATISLGAGIVMLIVTLVAERLRNPANGTRHPHGEVRAERASNHEGSSDDVGRESSIRPSRLGRKTGLAPQDEGGDWDWPSSAPQNEREDNRAASVAKFAVLSGLISYVVPNFLTYSAIPKIGSGLAAIMFALSPVVTAALSIALKVRPPTMLGVAGIGFGLVGVLVIILARGDDLSGGSFGWLLAALLIPVFLGIGNVYRTLAWPEGERPQRLAALTNLAAVPPLLLIALVWSGGIDLAPLAAAPGLVAVQVAVSAAMFLMFFRLQQVGGPTYLSQIGYVAAPVGVVIGVAWLGETYPIGVWAGAGVIAGGIAVSTLAQRRAERP